MEKINITFDDIVEFRRNHWVAYASQEKVEISFNLFGESQVFVDKKGLGVVDFDVAKTQYIEALRKKIPFYKIHVEFE